MNADAPKLIDRFKAAGDERPDLNALVIYHPESRTADMRELAACLDTPNQLKSTVVEELLDFIPPRTGRFSEIFPPKNLDNHHAGIVHKVLERAKIPKRGPKSSKLILYRETWYIAVVGDTPHKQDRREYLKLSGMAKEAARLLPEEAEGDTPFAKWIIHLADRETPLGDQSRRMVLRTPSLAFSGGNGIFSSPVWVPYVVGDSPSWWSAWLPNVYLLSAMAIEKLLPTIPENNINHPTVSNLDAYRNGGRPDGEFMDVEFCQDRYGITGPELSNGKKKGFDTKPIRHPTKTRREIHLWSVVRDMADHKDRKSEEGH
jgi:hypothetical protein